MSEGNTSPRKSNFWNAVLVLLFGGAMVALGAQEIHEHYGRETYSSRGFSDTLVQDLYGETEVNRAHLSPAAVKELKERRRAADAGETMTFKEFFTQFFPK